MEPPVSSQSNSPAAARSGPSAADHSGDQQQAADHSGDQQQAADHSGDQQQAAGPSSDRRLTAPQPFTGVGFRSLLTSATADRQDSNQPGWRQLLGSLDLVPNAMAEMNAHFREQTMNLTQAQALGASIQEREQQLEARGQALDARGQQLDAEEQRLNTMEPQQGVRQQELGARQQRLEADVARYQTLHAELNTQAQSLGAAMTQTGRRGDAYRAVQPYHTGQHLPSGEPDSTITYTKLCLYYTVYETACGLLAAAITGGLSFYALNTNKEDDTHCELKPEALFFLIFCAVKFALSAAPYLYTLYKTIKSCRRSQPLEDGAQPLASQARGLAAGAQLIVDVGAPPANAAARQPGGGGALFAAPPLTEEQPGRIETAPPAGAPANAAAAGGGMGVAPDAAGGQPGGGMGASAAAGQLAGGHRGMGA